MLVLMAGGLGSSRTYAQESWQEKLKEIEKQFATSAPALNTSDSKVQVSILLSVNKVHPGSQFQAAVMLDIQDRWHINAYVPSFDYLIGTELKLAPPEGVQVIEIRYPESKKLSRISRDAEEALDVYEGRSPVFVVLQVSHDIAVGAHQINGSLRVQACDDQVCLAPSTIEVALPFEVVAYDQPVAPINTELFSSVGGTAGGVAAGSAVVPVNEVTKLFESKGVTLAFLGIFAIGLALNLTPCVYPMLSVTVSLFGTQTDSNTLRVFFKALTYVLGIATMYSVLGVVAALSGGLFGGVLQSPVVLIAIGGLLFGLALSMFGLYELQMPYWLTSKLGGTATTGTIGIYLSGLVVGVFAAPCIGPPIIALLAFVGAKGDPVFGFWAFFVLSLGLGAPYLILGTFSGLLKKIPKSGAWMEWVKKIFGVVMTGAALFYVGLALFPKLTVYVVPLTLFAGGIYLGFLEPRLSFVNQNKEGRGKQNKTLRKIQWALGAIAVLLAAISLRALQKPGVDWESYSPQKLEQARIANKPVIMDFYADWCIPCLELDRLTFTDSKVIAATEDFVKLKVDLTHFNSSESEALRQQFNISGVPTIVFLGRDCEEVPGTRVVGYLPPEKFIERMHPALSLAEVHSADAGSKP
ncbi:thioredoxin family protein [candidate division KSB1 bacterium]|nr:thioredoxin family protein [candidate division KSB1 bacterium]